METNRRAMGLTEWSLLLILSLLWGGVPVFTKVALTELSPLAAVFGRVVLAVVALHIMVRLTGLRFPRSGKTWLAFLIMGALNNVIPFSLITYGQTRIGAGLAAVLNASTPLFTVLIAHLTTDDEKLTPAKAVGVGLGFGGAAVMIGPEVLKGLGWNVLAQAACLGGAVSFSLAGIYGRRFRDQPPLVVAAGQLTASALILTPLVLIMGRPEQLIWPGLPVWAALAGSGLLGAALAYVIYFRILAAAGATNVLLVTLIVPVNAMILAGLLLGESITAGQLAGMALIALGLLIIDGRLVRLIRVTAA